MKLLGAAPAQPVVVYSGHDARFEYIYKFVSSANWDPSDVSPVDRLATGAKYLDGAVYTTLTNNTRRTGETPETDVNPANPPLDNEFGHIIRWVESDTTAFTWDIFLFGAPAAGDVNINLSGLTDLNQFASPDGMNFDPRGILWILTDNGDQFIVLAMRLRSDEDCASRIMMVDG